VSNKGAIAYFEELGSAVRDRWAASGFENEDLPAIAESTLRDVERPDDLDVFAILGHVASGEALPPQSPLSDRFGEPPVILYQEGDLLVQALTWMDGSTSIHQHGFDGAFLVLQGSSLHVEYSFEAHQRLADGHLLLGDLCMVKVEVLTAGDVRTIVAGNNFIHALFHLERPSVTIVVRNQSSNLPYPQYSFRRPGIAHDVIDLTGNERLGKQLQGLDALYRLDPAIAGRAATELVTHADLWTSYVVTNHHWHTGNPAFPAMLDKLEQRSTDFVDFVRPSFEETDRQAKILSRRTLLDEPHQRLLLALLANLPDRASIAAIVEAVYPGANPNELLADWVAELATPRYRSVSGLRLDPSELRTLVNGDGTLNGDGTVNGDEAPPANHGDSKAEVPPLIENLFR
jgi:hypothetical protein